MFGFRLSLGGCLMTNYHVMEPIISGTVKPTAAVFRFDYRRLPNGVVSRERCFHWFPPTGSSIRVRRALSIRNLNRSRACRSPKAGL